MTGTGLFSSLSLLANGLISFFWLDEISKSESVGENGNGEFSSFRIDRFRGVFVGVLNSNFSCFLLLYIRLQNTVLD